LSILLTGGAGYIGSHTAAVLADAGQTVVLYDSLRNSSAEAIRRLHAITRRPPVFVEGDIRHTGRLARVLQEHGVEAVIHMAGLKTVAESISEPIDYYHTNVQGTLSLLDAMDSLSIHRLVFSSSATVYGEPAYLPIDEEHPLRATNPYGRTKLHIEDMLLDLARSNPRWSIACLRYFNPAGAHESGLIGESPRGVPTNLMPHIAEVAAGSLSRLTVFGGDYDTPDGTGIRDFIHVMDLAEGHLAALDFLSANTGWHAFNLGTGRGYSVLEMIAAFTAASGRPIPYRFQPRRPGDVAVCYADPGKAERLLGWKAWRSLEAMCASTWRWRSGGHAEDASGVRAWA